MNDIKNNQQKQRKWQTSLYNCFGLNSVTLLSTETEYYATLQIAKEVIFAKNLWEETKISFQ
jgi:hypothetical protein